MSADILSKINDRYITACIFHRENADLFWWTYNFGFAMWHEYQNMSESLTQRKLKRLITTTYGIAVIDNIPESANILEPLTTGKDRNRLQPQELKSILKESFTSYKKWESDTLKIYEKYAAELLQKGDLSEFNFISNLVKEVKEELTFLTDIIVDLQGFDWDLTEISARQTDIFERMEKLIRELLGKSSYFHHNNSAYSANDRLSVFDKKGKNKD